MIAIFLDRLTRDLTSHKFLRVTVFIATLVMLYIASLCFVVALLTRTLWRERANPLDSAATVLTITSTSRASAPDNQATVSALHATKSA